MFVRNFKILSVLILSSWLVACSNLYESHDIVIEESDVIYSATLTDKLGDFKAVNVIGDEQWYFDSRGYVIVSGFVENTNKANEAWLISPEIDLTEVETARLTFDHVTRYFANPLSEATVWVSENYVDDQSPAAATWTQLLTDPFTDPGDWTFGSSGEISLTAYAGKNIRIGFKYISTTAKAGSWELKNFLVRRGEAVVVDRKWGKGTEIQPFTVAGAISNQSGEKWVSGIIVGYVWSGSFTNFVFGADTCTQATNIILADTTTTYLSKTMVVQLPSGPVRTALNLKDNKGLLGKKVTLAGSLEAYFGAPGLKNTMYYDLGDGKTGGTKPVIPILSETFANNRQGAFIIENVTLPTQLPFVWATSASYGMVASARTSGVNYVAESWLISPEFSLADVSTATLVFDHALNYLNAAKKTDVAQVMLSSTYTSGSPATASWAPLTIPVYPSGSNFTFVSSGAISLDDYAGADKLRIAFKYVSVVTDATKNPVVISAPTWEIKNVLIK